METFWKILAGFSSINSNSPISRTIQRTIQEPLKDSNTKYLLNIIYIFSNLY